MSSVAWENSWRVNTLLRETVHREHWSHTQKLSKEIRKVTKPSWRSSVTPQVFCHSLTFPVCVSVWTQMPHENKRWRRKKTLIKGRIIIIIIIPVVFRLPLLVIYFICVLFSSVLSYFFFIWKKGKAKKGKKRRKSNSSLKFFLYFISSFYLSSFLTLSSSFSPS